MSKPKVFAVLVETVPELDAVSAQNREHNQRQRAWFAQMATEGKLLACGPWAGELGPGLWLLRARGREDALAILESSPRWRDGMVDRGRTRVVEWAVSVGKEKFSGGVE
jgi:uncharacterized protein YciI